MPSSGHSGRDNGKTKKIQGPPEDNSSNNNKDGYREGVRVQLRTILPLSGRENIPKKSKKRKGKIRYSSCSSSATSTSSDSDSSNNKPTI